MRKRTAAVLAVGAVALPLLGGCGLDSANVAARVAGNQLTVPTVGDRVRAFFDAFSSSETCATKQSVASITVENFVRANVIDATAAAYGITATEGEVDELISANGGIAQIEQVVGQQRCVPPDPELARIEVRSFVLQDKIQDLAGPDADEFERAAALTDRTAEVSKTLGIAVNPRFGTWTGNIVAAGESSLSITQDEAEALATATPTPTGVEPTSSPTP